MGVEMSAFRPGFHALVVGGGGGIGRALVQELLARGAGCVYAAARHPVGTLPDRALPLSLDVTEESSIAAAADEIRRAGSLDLVINTAGVLQDGPLRPERRLQDVTPANLLHSFRVNAFGPILLAKHLVPLLGHGQHAVFASLSARVGSIADNRLGGWYAYRAAKAAQNQLLHTLAVETARRNPALICVALHPGTVDTELSRPFQSGVKPEKLFTPEQSAGYLLDVIAGLTREHHGGFYAWDAQPIPW
jgi:NAD(P)-dependent dehydrogenase (short-subunit alcohol dehydrogenase family)